MQTTHAYKILDGIPRKTGLLGTYTKWLEDYRWTGNGL